MVTRKSRKKRSSRKGSGRVTKLTIDNMEELVKMHPGEFAATDGDGRIIAFGDTPGEALRRARKKGESKPILFQVSENACAWVF